MAAQLGQAVGKRWELTAGTDIDALETTPNSLAPMRYKFAMPQQEPPVAGGEVTIREFVRVRFQLE